MEGVPFIFREKDRNSNYHSTVVDLGSESMALGASVSPVTTATSSPTITTPPTAANSKQVHERSLQKSSRRVPTLFVQPGLWYACISLPPEGQLADSKAMEVQK